MNLSDYMGGRCLWKFNSMRGGLNEKYHQPGTFFSGIALTRYSHTINNN